MKRFFTVVLIAASTLALTGCDFLTEWLETLIEDGEVEYVDQWADMVNETAYEAAVDGPTLTYGNHKYTIVTELDPETTEFGRATATVTFTNIPSGYTEFAAVYNGLLGKSLAG